MNLTNGLASLWNNCFWTKHKMRHDMLNATLWLWLFSSKCQLALSHREDSHVLGTLLLQLRRAPGRTSLSIRHTKFRPQVILLSTLPGYLLQFHMSTTLLLLILLLIWVVVVLLLLFFLFLMRCKLHLAPFGSLTGQHLHCIFKKGLCSGPLQDTSKPNQVCFPSLSRTRRLKNLALTIQQSSISAGAMC